VAFPGRHLNCVSAAPVARLVQSARQDRESLRLVALAYSHRFGVTTAAAERLLNRLLQGQRYIEEGTADRLAVFFGRHPSELWPGEVV
jgi:hypothetical protein